MCICVKDPDPKGSRLGQSLNNETIVFSETRVVHGNTGTPRSTTSIPAFIKQFFDTYFFPLTCVRRKKKSLRTRIKIHRGLSPGRKLTVDRETCNRCLNVDISLEQYRIDVLLSQLEWLSWSLGFSWSWLFLLRWTPSWAGITRLLQWYLQHWPSLRSTPPFLPRGNVNLICQ